MRGIAKTGIILVALSLILLSSFYAYAAQTTLEYDNSTKTVLIKLLGNNITEIQLISTKESLSYIGITLRFKPYISFTTESDDFNMLPVKITDSTIISKSVTLQRKVNATMLNRTELCNPYTFKYNLTSETNGNTTNTTAEYSYTVNNCTVSYQSITQEILNNTPINFSSISVTAGKDYYITFGVSILPEVGRRTIDLLPKVSGYNLSQFVLFNNSWFYHEDAVNSTGLPDTVNVPYLVNGTNGVDVGGEIQRVWAKAELVNTTNRLWYINYTTYEMTNSSNVTLPFEVESGNGTSINASQLFGNDEMFHLRCGTNLTNPKRCVDSTKYGRNFTMGENTSFTSSGLVAGGVRFNPMPTTGSTVDNNNTNFSSEYFTQQDPQNFTYIMWIKPEYSVAGSAGETKLLFNKGGSLEDDISFSLSRATPGTLTLLIDNGGAFGRCTAGMNVTADNWQMIAASWDIVTRQPRLYLNDTYYSCSVTNSSFASVVTPIGMQTMKGIYVGSQWVGDSQRLYNGSMDEIMMFNQSLTAAQIKMIYQATSLSVLSATRASNATPNTAPSLSGLTILPNPAYVNDVLNVSVLYNDSEANNGTVKFYWYRNGINVQNNTLETINNTNVTAIDAFTAVHFDNISVLAEVNDSAVGVNVSTANLTISDTVSVVRTISLNLATAYVNDTLNASLVYNDIDVDNGACTLQWFRNGINTDNLTRTGLTNSTNMTDLYSGTAFIRYDNMSFKANCTSNNLGSAAVSSSNLTVSNTAPAINYVNVTVTGLNTATDVRISMNVTDLDGATDLKFCSAGGQGGQQATIANDICNINIGDALVNNSIALYVNDSSHVNGTRTIFINISYRISTDRIRENVTVRTTHNVTIVTNLTANAQNINETNIETNITNFLGNATNTTDGRHNRTSIFINASFLNEVNGTVLAVNETNGVPNCVSINAGGVTRWTCRTYIDVRHQYTDILNVTYNLSPASMNSWDDRFAASEIAGVNNLTTNVNGDAFASKEINITILDGFALRNGSNEVRIVYDVPIIGEGGAPGGGGGGGSGFVQAACGNFTYRPSDKITGYGIPGTDIAPFGIYVINGDTPQGFSISLSKEVQQLCRVTPLSSEVLRANGAVKFTATCTAPTEKVNGNFNIDSTQIGCSAAIPVELVPTAGVLFGLMEFVRLMAVGAFGSALTVNVFFLPIFIWFIVIAGIIIVIWKI